MVRQEDKRTPNARGRSTKSKTPVFGMVECKMGKTQFHVVSDTKARTLQDIITASVKPGSMVNSDEWVGYRGLGMLYDHNVIDHGDQEYVRGSVHANAIENRWSHFRRTLIGTYHWVSRKYLGRYVDESDFWLNSREMSQGERFDETLSGCEVMLTYSRLVTNR